jgi:predicted alpha/beta-fold hydrolase
VDVTAPTVVLLHGLGDDEIDGGWARAAMVVAGTKANVTWVRLPDHELPTIRSTLGPVEGETVRAALAQLVTTCHLTGPVAVWGMSWGGAIAAHVARADLDAHDRGENAIVGGVLLESPVLDLSKSIAALDGWSAWLDVATVQKVFRQILCRRTEPDLPAGQCAKRRKGLRFRTAAASWLQLSGRALDAELVRRSAIGLLPRIGRAMVATVLVASNDPVLPREPVEDLRELRAPVTIIETPRGGHAGYLAVCRPFMERVVADWLERVRKSWQPASPHLPLGGNR